MLFGAAIVLLLNIVVASARIGLGPDARNRLTGLLLLSTTGTAVLVLLAQAMDVPALRDAALALVALAALIIIVRIVGEKARA
ncbi:hypothetical protein [Hoyosella altamirensis]|uniref:Multicomponent Na+:H+ antiporter subunit F n=1 Tax=Hoyosella altamirensis TaxID=616997 RepID=A0A839RRA8_9ACTN|nr:hypothetical protein [Hoyosella altamirensis]MBB3038644.1 multicomponent Na+:H+ antiporter subunit F [Hoyosella altamirensis]